MTLRAWYNVILCRLGLRRILPRDFVNAIPIAECGKELVKFQDHLVRRGVAQRLQKVEESLYLSPYKIKVVSGYRTLEEQQHLWERAGGDHRFSANPTGGKGGGHQTGGAVDVVLLKHNKEVDMGTAYAEHTLKVLTHSKEITSEQREARKLLCKVMSEAGFVNYPAEWWHFCYGDQMWAAYKNRRKAIYGKV